MNPRAHNLIIAVVGGSGAGKSWLVQRLCRLVGEDAGHLSMDNFYRDRSHLSLVERARTNFDVPGAIDWNEAARVLHDCRSGLPSRVPEYDFSTYSRTPHRRTWIPRRVTFVDGLWLLRPAALRPLFDLSVYLDAAPSLRLERRLARDTTERGYTPAAVRRRLATMVFPMHERYVAPQRRVADIVLAQPFRGPEIERFADRLWELLSRHGLTPSWGLATFRTEMTSLLVQHEYCV